MKKAIKKRWLKALRSGKYKQGTGWLRNGEEYCCLGVLCDIYGKEKWETHATNSFYSFLGSTCTMVQKVLNWSGLTRANGDNVKLKNGDIVCLSSLNDNGLTFEQIADLIEEQL